ncbi:hypothetical protein cyc_00135 [Cyclospora cayetanensis]|uniref:Uncharacterized protein n=1 Tax=Cyclospora cayetanensis TaxID=88456 RepID=A0A1D3D9X4_9EIME|nr:hypothetical protein cyc_00135 [Cyclospora cayetanensis]
MSRSVRPWRSRSDLGTEDWRNQVYMVTHALLVVSGWGRFSLDLRERFWLPDCRFLRFALHEAIAVDDVEMAGEILHDGASGRGSAAVWCGLSPLTEDEEAELQAEAFALRLAVQHGIVFLLAKQQKGCRGRWTPKDETQYKTFHASYCAAMGLIRPHRGGQRSAEADRQHAEWQELFVSPPPEKLLSDPSCCCKLAAAEAAHRSTARKAARESLMVADSEVSPYLSCAVSALIRPPAEDEAASLISRIKAALCVLLHNRSPRLSVMLLLEAPSVSRLRFLSALRDLLRLQRNRRFTTAARDAVASTQVTIRVLHRPVSCKVWRKLACSNRARRLKLFREASLLAQLPVGHQEVSVAVYTLRHQRLGSTPSMHFDIPAAPRLRLVATSRGC